MPFIVYRNIKTQNKKYLYCFAIYIIIIIYYREFAKKHVIKRIFKVFNDINCRNYVQYMSLKYVLNAHSQHKLNVCCFHDYVQGVR